MIDQELLYLTIHFDSHSCLVISPPQFLVLSAFPYMDVQTCILLYFPVVCVSVFHSTLVCFSVSECVSRHCLVCFHIWSDHLPSHVSRNRLTAQARTFPRQRRPQLSPKCHFSKKLYFHVFFGCLSQLVSPIGLKPFP